MQIPVVTPLTRCRESIDLGMRPVRPGIFLGRVESASNALDLTITGDLLRAVSQRPKCFATPLSTDSMP